MTFIRAEAITLPLRFLFLTAHFIAILAVAFDLDGVTSNMLNVNPSMPGTSRAAVANYSSSRQTLAGLTYAALACFGLEYISLALGLSLFLRKLTLLNIMAHFSGLVLTVLFNIDSWSLGAYIAFIVVFNFVPLVLEVLVMAFMSRFTYARY